MKKAKLSIERLEVESFTTSEIKSQKGGVTMIYDCWIPSQLGCPTLGIPETCIE
jgi:hypothetical protein